MKKILEYSTKVLCCGEVGIIVDNDAECTEEHENINYYVKFDGGYEWLLRSDFTVLN